MTNVRSAPPTTALHPLDPLSPAELEAAVRIVREARSLGEQVRFCSVVLKEPLKQEVLRYRAGDSFQRRALLIVRYTGERTTAEVVVNLTEERVESFTPREGVQPPITLDEFFL